MLQKNTLGALFFDQLAMLLNGEKQVLQFLPTLIARVDSKELKEALMLNLHETENHITRIERIFVILGREVKELKSMGIEALISEEGQLIENLSQTPLSDAAIISGLQKIEHYEIASYGTLRSFANHLSFDNKVIDLLQDSLDEESTADKKLTKIADGSFFFSGVNEEAAENLGPQSKDQ